MFSFHWVHCVKLNSCTDRYNYGKTVRDHIIKKNSRTHKFPEFCENLHKITNNVCDPLTGPSNLRRFGQSNGLKLVMGWKFHVTVGYYNNNCNLFLDEIRQKIFLTQVFLICLEQGLTFAVCY